MTPRPTIGSQKERRGVIARPTVGCQNGSAKGWGERHASLPPVPRPHPPVILIVAGAASRHLALHVCTEFA